MKKEIVVVGASAGGIDALKTLVSGLPKDFPAALLVVLHISADSPGILGMILERAGQLPTVTVYSKTKLRPGCIYVAAPDHHLIVERGVACPTRGPKENRFRPAVDPLFRSSAQAYGQAVIGIVLTGGLDDGTAGLHAVKQLGGTAIVQDPADAFADSMPRSALAHVAVDHCIAVAAMAPLLVQLTAAPAPEKGEISVTEDIDIEVKIARQDNALEAGVMKLGAPSIYACPECHGVLLQLEEGNRVRFRCHTGHAYSAQTLLAEFDQNIEKSLWSSIRAIEEKVLFMQHLARHAGEGVASEHSAEWLLDRASDADRQAALVRRAAFGATG